MIEANFQGAITATVASCQQSTQRLLQQRLYALALGYEDLNDHDTLGLKLPKIGAVIVRDTLRIRFLLSSA